MMRFCPNCETERPMNEVFCGGEVGGRACNWDLSTLPIRSEGWRPGLAGTISTHAAHTSTCPSGHAISAGDLLCATCGCDIPANAGAVGPECSSDRAIAVSGWRLGERLPSQSRVRQRYRVTEEGSGRRGVLTLYNAGAEPDPAVYDVLRSMLKDHVPDIYLTGRWEDRAYEVDEELICGTLADLRLVPNSPTSLERVVEELARALNAFSECGLRHRDLRAQAVLI